MNLSMVRNFDVVNEIIVLYSTGMVREDQDPATGASSPAYCDRPRRREARREERRDSILEVATRYFLDHGYAGTTMSGIAASLGGSKGTLWSYYASKDLLFGDVLDRVTRDSREQLDIVLNRDEPIEVGLLQVCDRFLEQITNADAVALHRLVVGEAGRFPEMGRIFFERVFQRVHLPLTRYIAAAMDRGDLRKDDPAEASNVLTALCMADCHQRLVTGVLQSIPEDLAPKLACRAVDKFLRIYR